jgi:hypothetical protein
MDPAHLKAACARGGQGSKERIGARGNKNAAAQHAELNCQKQEEVHKISG